MVTKPKRQSSHHRGRLNRKMVRYLKEPSAGNYNQLSEGTNRIYLINYKQSRCGGCNDFSYSAVSLRCTDIPSPFKRRQTLAFLVIQSHRRRWLSNTRLTKEVDFWATGNLASRFWCVIPFSGNLFI